MKRRMRKAAAFLMAAALCAGSAEASGQGPGLFNWGEARIDLAYAAEGTNAAAEMKSQTESAEVKETEAEIVAAETKSQTEGVETEKTEAESAAAETKSQTESVETEKTETESMAAGSTENPAESTAAGATENSAESAAAGTTENSAGSMAAGATENSDESAAAGATESPAESAAAQTAAESAGTEAAQTEDAAAGQRKDDTGAGDAQEEKKEDGASKTEKKKEDLIVKNGQGETVALEEICGPKKLTSGKTTHPVEYGQGVYRLRLTAGEESLEITVPDQAETERISFTRWGGYLTEQEETWLLCPDDPVDGAYMASGNTYALDLEKFLFGPEEVTLEQLAVYGDLDDEKEYAEIFVSGEGRSQVLLIEFTEEESEFQEDDTEAEQATELSEDDAEAEQETEFPEDDTEAETPEQETEVWEMEVEAAEEGISLLAAQAQVDAVYASVGTGLASSAKEYTPTIGSMNGEWQILGLVRSGQAVEDGLYSKYLSNVVEEVKEKEGVLHAKKYTEYSRLVLALTALGEDVTNVGGYNLLEPLADFDQTVWQGINGATWALLAFDSHDYEIPAAPEGKTQTTRAKLINHILGLEISGGGWAMSGNTADPDVTAMAIQALAPYYSSNTAVKEAVDRGVAKLSALQMSDGGYASWGTTNSESCSQVIVALTALGIDPNTDARFVKNGKSVVDALLTYSTSSGAFKHVADGNADQMATEQGYYALTAYQRFINGQTSLYDMSDVALQSDYQKAAAVDALIQAIPGSITADAKDSVQAALTAYNSLSALQQSLVQAANASRLQEAVAALAALDIELESETQKESETEAITEKTGDSGTAANKNGKNTSSSGKTPSGTTKSVNLVSGRAGGTTVSGVSSRSSVKSGEESEEETETENGKKTGATQSSAAARAVISDIGKLFRNTKESQKLPESAADYSDAQVEAVLNIYRSMEELSDDEKETVEKSAKYEDYLAVLEKLREENHYDEATGTDLRDNGEELLPWYIRLEVDPGLEEGSSWERASAALKERGAVFSMWDIHLVDLKDGGEWQPEDLIRVSVPMTDIGEYEYAAVVHLKDDGTMEFLEGHIAASNLEFDTDHFSDFGIVGFDGSIEELMEEEARQEPFGLWLLPGAAAAALLVLLLILRRMSAGKECERL